MTKRNCPQDDSLFMPKPKPKQIKSEQFTPRKIKIRVIGIGGGGAAIVSEMSGIMKAVSFYAADTDLKTFKRLKKSVKPFQFGEKLTLGLGTGLNPELAQRAACEEKAKIAKLFKDCDLVVLVGALGGGVGSGAGPVFAEIAAEQKVLSLGIFTLPFSFEGEKKTRVAKKALVSLQEKLSAAMVVPNERIFLLVDKKTPLKKSLSLLNQTFAFWLADLLAVIIKPGLINIDFADLKAVLDKRGMKLFLSKAVTQGPLRAEEAAKNIFQNPFFDEKPKNVKRILFNITGGRDLALKEVETISKTIAALNPKAKIIFGITENTSRSGKIQIILLAVCENHCAVVEEPPAPPSLKLLRASKTNKTNKKDKTKEASKKTSRRSAVEVKQANEEEKDREWAQEADWEVPAFMR